MLKIGLTGGIGSGKSTVARIFELLQIPVYHSDQEARRLMQENPGLIMSIRSLFGDKAYDASGQLDRQYIASKVFSDPEALDQLNALVHPVTIADSESWAKMQQTPYVIKEAALLFESHAFHLLDAVVGVSAPQALRIHRCMKRDHSSRESVRKRMEAQMDEDIKLRLCDYVIVNNDLELLIPQVLSLHQRFLDLSHSQASLT